MVMDTTHRNSFMEDFEMIKKKSKLAIKFISFVLVTCICVGMVNEWLKPKYFYNQNWPTTNTYIDFYRLEKNSVDVLFFGSSHAISSYNPQVIYDNYGITSYNLGSEQQSIVVSYYWLREALKYQSPKVIILDTYMLHKYFGGSMGYVDKNMNCDEFSIRKAMDNMRLSPLKWEAGKVIEELDPRNRGLSFLLLNIRYHTRWTSLDEDDYTEESMIEHGGIKGFAVRGGTNPDLSYIPFKDSETSTADAEPMVETSKEYLDKIVALCAEKNIQLILANIPCVESIGRYKAIKEYADSHELSYYDFSEEVLYNEIDYSATENLIDHLNYLGAEKVSLYIGNLLATKYGIQPREDRSYDLSRKLYEHKIENINLTNITDIFQYLDKINNDNYSVFIFAPAKYSTYINDEIMTKLFTLGFATDLREMPYYIQYCAVKDPSGVTEQLSADGIISFSGSIRGGLTTYNFNMDRENQTYSMMINGIQCCDQNAGLNIIIYDNDLKNIVDRVNFNTDDVRLTATRY